MKRLPPAAIEKKKLLALQKQQQELAVQQVEESKNVIISSNNTSQAVTYSPSPGQISQISKPENNSSYTASSNTQPESNSPRLRKRIEDLEKLLISATNQEKFLNYKLSNKDSAIESLNQQINDLRQDKINLRQDKKALSSKVENLEAKLESFRLFTPAEFTLNSSFANEEQQVLTNIEEESKNDLTSNLEKNLQEINTIQSEMIEISSQSGIVEEKSKTELQESIVLDQVHPPNINNTNQDIQEDYSLLGSITEKSYDLA